jgi:hypothetical protein
MEDLGAVVLVLVDGDDLGRVADGARWQLFVQGLEQPIPLHAPNFVKSPASA